MCGDKQDNQQPESPDNKKIPYKHGKRIGNFNIVKQDDKHVWVTCRICDSPDVEKYFLSNLMKGSPAVCKKCRDKLQTRIPYKGSSYIVAEFMETYRISYYKISRYLKGCYSDIEDVFRKRSSKIMRTGEPIGFSDEFLESKRAKSLGITKETNRVDLAKKLGISKQALHLRMKKYPNEPEKWIRKGVKNAKRKTDSAS